MTSPSPSTPSISRSSTVPIVGGVMNANPEAKAKQTKGRRKIPIRKIENKNKKHVTFSKRRKGLFTKASELCVLCGASVAVITFSEAGKAFSFGHPSPDAVIHRYLHGTVPASPPPPPLDHSHSDDINIDDGSRVFWWEQPVVEELGFEELGAFGASLAQLRTNVETRIAEMDLIHQSKPTNLAVGPVKIESNNNNNYCNMPDYYLSLPPPPPPQNQEYFQQCGCDDEGIASIVAMADPNRFARRFGEF